jgi:hypothetical protein
MNVKQEIKRAIKYGIFLGDLEPEEQEEIFKDLFSFLIEKRNFCTLKDMDKTILVSSDIEELAEVFIHAGTLKVIPLSSDGYFKLFMDVLEFVADRHKKEIESFKNIKDDSDDDESTEEDFEWL